MGTAALAANFARPFGGEKAAALAGLVHDLGKYAPAFQAYIRGEGPGPEHAIAGAKWLAEVESNAQDQLIAKLLAHGVAGHHGGLPDTDAETGSLMSRLKANSEPLDPAWEGEIAPEATGLLPTGFQPSGNDRIGFELAFLGRMLFSALVDADFKDTESYYARIEGRKVNRDWPALAAVLPDLQNRFDAYMARLAESEDNPVKALRREVLDHVRSQAGRATDCYTLTVPTGGGKTLTSLGFALDHAAFHRLRRIVYAIPFTSIIDQTASIFKDVLGEDVVLEHHSALEPDTADKREWSARDKLRLAMEDWAAPVVVTTHVQLFESLFAARPGRCRKLHALAGSVIVLDEVQTLPLSLLKPCIAALRELVRTYGVTVVLCTATQPALDSGHFPGDPLMGLDLVGKELAPDPPALARRLTRTAFRHVGVMDNAALVEALEDCGQALIIVNSRRHALELYRAAQTAGLDGVIHLSTRQCAAHRRQILDDIRGRLNPRAPRPCRTIATSLVEAGVDVDFPRVWRAEAGLEQVVQAAGRCNREGKRAVADSLVTVFAAPDYPTPRELRRNADVFSRIAASHPDWTAPETVERYFRELYWTSGAGALDRIDIFKRFVMVGCDPSFDYRSVAEEFHMVESFGAPIIIPDPKNKAILAKLDISTVPSGLIARELQTWIVQPPERDRARLIGTGSVRFWGGADRADQFAVLEDERLYTPETGLIWEEDKNIWWGIV